MIAVPAQNSVDPSLRHARLPWSVRQALQRVAGVIAFVGDQLRRCLWRGYRIKRGQLLYRDFERDRQADSVALVGCVQFGRDELHRYQGPTHAQACRPDGCGHPSTWRSSRPDRPDFPSRRSTASCPSVRDPAAPDHCVHRRAPDCRSRHLLRSRPVQLNTSFLTSAARDLLDRPP